MGEYWKPFNLTKKEHLNPHNFGCGLKLGEWDYFTSPVMKAIVALFETGRWSISDGIRKLSDYGGELQMYGIPVNECNSDHYHENESDNISEEACKLISHPYRRL